MKIWIMRKEASVNGKFGLLKRSSVITSMRRIDNEGHFPVIMKALRGQWHYHRGTLKGAPIDYSFGNYKQRDKKDL